jgi:hypothetical protein
VDDAWTTAPSLGFWTWLLGQLVSSEPGNELTLRIELELARGCGCGGEGDLSW